MSTAKTKTYTLHLKNLGLPIVTPVFMFILKKALLFWYAGKFLEFPAYRKTSFSMYPENLENFHDDAKRSLRVD